jgi:hypothetical protein
VVLTLSEYKSVKDTAELTRLNINTVYFYLTKGLIEGAVKFAETRWMVPIQWIKDYNAGKIKVKGAFKGRYASYGKNYNERKKKTRERN